MSAVIRGTIADIANGRLFQGELEILGRTIREIRPLNRPSEPPGYYLIPGFIDAHVHIESSMLIPSEFARLAVVHGTVATVSDPHEIANVCGIEGVEFMIENGKRVPFKFYFGAPSCVPATTFETAGGSLNAAEVETLLQREEIRYLSEMMNFPGVLNEDEEVLKKIKSAHNLNKPVDGHAPGLRGDLAIKYIDAGISTDHECFTKEEALEKLNGGMKIIIREGSAAKNFEALIDLLHDYPDMIMFCSDDKHPDSLVRGHINQLCSRAIAKGIDVFKVLKAACVNPVQHYNLAVGLLKEGDPADFIVVKDLKNFEIVQTFINGELVAENGKSLIKSRKLGVGSRELAVGSQESGVGSQEPRIVNNFNCNKKTVEDFEFHSPRTTHHSPFTTHHSPLTTPVIEAVDGQLVTNKVYLAPKIENGNQVSDIENDILKIVVVNRYTDAPIAKAFIKNFGLKQGALASSVAHDSHNIVAVGVDDESLCKAVNMVIEHKGGVSCIKDNLEMIVPLPVAGLMSSHDGYKVAEQYSVIDKAAKEAGSTLSSPFMTLSFMSLLVIPHLKLSDKGLFDGDNFCFL